MIRLARPELTDEDVAAVVEVLKSGQLVQGPQVAAFEQAIGALIDTPHVAAVCNGTAALQLGLMALGIEPGDRVAVGAYSWPASANAIVRCGAVPVFIDIETHTFGMDPNALERAFAHDHGIRAVMPVHVFGQMAQIESILTIARAHGAAVIEDAACALGARRTGRAAGTWGDIGCFSFHPRKAATTGEGGAIVCRDATQLRHVRVMRNHGQDPASALPDFIDAGFNMRLSEMQAALGVSQLKRYDSLLQRRQQLAARYDALLADLPVMVPRESEPGAHIYQSYVVLLAPHLAPRRTAIIAALRARGVETTIGTYHQPLLTFYRQSHGHVAGDHPVSEDIAARAVALPLHAMLSEEDLDTVVSTLRDVIGT